MVEDVRSVRVIVPSHIGKGTHVGRVPTAQRRRAALVVQTHSPDRNVRRVEIFDELWNVGTIVFASRNDEMRARHESCLLANAKKTNDPRAHRRPQFSRPEWT